MGYWLRWVGLVSLAITLGVIAASWRPTPRRTLPDTPHYSVTFASPPDDRIATLDAEIANAPFNPFWLLERARAHRLAERYPTAISDCENAVALAERLLRDKGGTNGEDLLLARADALLEISDIVLRHGPHWWRSDWSDVDQRAAAVRPLLAAAHDDYRNVAVGSGDSRAYQGLARCAGAQLMAGSRAALDEAIDEASRLMALFPDRAGPVGLRGVLRLFKLDYDTAVKDLSTAIDLEPAFCVWYLGRSAAYRGKGDSTHAETDLAVYTRLLPALRAQYLPESGDQAIAADPQLPEPK